MARQLKTAGYRGAGTPVCVSPHKSAPGKGMSYGSFCGKLMEGGRIGPQAGWDVIDIRDTGGQERSAYSFDVRPRPRTRRR
jgi:hypothetical protein